MLLTMVRMMQALVMMLCDKMLMMVCMIHSYLYKHDCMIVLSWCPRWVAKVCPRS